MKKIISLLVALPAVCLALGYGAGVLLDKPEPAEVISSTGAHEASDDTHGPPSDDAHASVESEHEPIIVRLGQMVIPVYKPRSVTYVVINLGITVEDSSHAEYYNIGENGVRLRDAILASLKHSADGRSLRGPSIDAEALSQTVAAVIKPKFEGISDVLFLDFYKKDIARS